MPTPRNLFLIGPMGAGKTTIGELLAKEMGWGFLDCDREMERRTGCRISDIFAKEGETVFRRREKKLLAELAGSEKNILATGGGAVLDSENRALMQRRGRIAYLHAPVSELARRVGSTKERPLLQQGGELPEKVLARLAMERDELYQALAQQSIDTDACTPPGAAAALAAWLREENG